MPLGPGKYDNAATIVREATKAEGVILIVIKGVHGSGFSVQATPEQTASLPDTLEMVANEIRASVKAKS
jgi:hypothetical protein